MSNQVILRFKDKDYIDYLKNLAYWNTVFSNRSISYNQLAIQAIMEKFPMPSGFNGSMEMGFASGVLL